MVYIQQRCPATNRYRKTLHIVYRSDLPMDYIKTVCGKLIYPRDRRYSELPPNLTICQKCQEKQTEKL